ncbi:Zn(II)2Cys6 transcription factor domain-containing protein [Aspergillus stella-maris]|uniref:Zn(II)2Cys6 transcription factor domain-containing protein n=1 Tax=Aspergillus stella-maris TaxID=1810926 RepID=UPI003CCDB48A
MTDHLLSAWTTQYTNTPPPGAMANTCEKRVPRRKAVRSCLNCQRGHKTCDNERPCEQCRKRGMAETCVDGNRKPPKYLIDSAYKPRIRKPHRKTHRGESRSFEEKAPEFINPSLLYLGGSSQQSSPEVDDITVVRSLRPGKSNSVSSTSEVEDSSPEACLPGNDFEDIFTELLAFDTIRPQGSNISSYDKSEVKQVQDGFMISAGWSSTFFPPGLEESATGIRSNF